MHVKIAQLPHSRKRPKNAIFSASAQKSGRRPKEYAAEPRRSAKREGGLCSGATSR
jgi:hypothetical protein